MGTRRITRAGHAGYSRMRVRDQKANQGSREVFAIECAVSRVVVTAVYKVPHDVLSAAVEPGAKILHQGVEWIAVNGEEVRGKRGSWAI